MLIAKILIAMAMSVVNLAPKVARETQPGFGRYSVSNMSTEDLIKAVFGPEAPNALKVAFCESKFDPSVTGRFRERGIFQIHPVHRKRIESMGYTWDQMYEVLPNIKVAYEIWSEQGWKPWTCRPK